MGSHVCGFNLMKSEYHEIVKTGRINKKSKTPICFIVVNFFLEEKRKNYLGRPYGFEPPTPMSEGE